MTPDQVALVRETFAKVAPISDAAAAMFYGRLFEIAPDVEPMFKADLATQGGKLMTSLGMVVNALDDLEKLLPVVSRLASSHVSYGVRPEHYAPVGAALIWTLNQGLGELFTPEAEEAWEQAYGLLSTAMIDAAYPATVITKLSAAE